MSQLRLFSLLCAGAYSGKCCTAFLHPDPRLCGQPPVSRLWRPAADPPSVVSVGASPLWGDRIGNRLTHHAAMDAVLGCQPMNRFAGSVAAPDLFE
jgi:hypothetical protein